MVAPVTSKAVPPQDFKGKTIVVDPGHGGHDGGAIAPNGMLEKNVNLSVALNLANQLKKAGANVILTRSTDKFIPLPGRAAIANAAKADLFVSVHQNSAANGAANGTETYFNKAGAAGLSKRVQEELVKSFGFGNRGSRHANFAVIRRTTMPGILTEASFLSNPQVAKILKTKNGQQRQAVAIFSGLKRQFGIKIEPVVVPKTVAKPKPMAEKKVQIQTIQVDINANVGIGQPKETNPVQIPVKNGYGLVNEKAVDRDVVGSIDVFKPPVDITAGLSAGLVE